MARPELPIPAQYFCKYCNQPKSVEDMDQGQKKKPSQSMCKDCRWKRAAKWKREHVAVSLLQWARRRVKESGLPCDLTAKDIFVPKVCPVLGITLVKGTEGPQDSSPTLDRIIPELGYVKGNVVVISYKANRIKSNGSAEEVRKVADWMDSQTQSAERFAIETAIERVDAVNSGKLSVEGLWDLSIPVSQPEKELVAA